MCQSMHRGALIARDRFKALAPKQPMTSRNFALSRKSLRTTRLRASTVVGRIVADHAIRIIT